MAIMDFLKGTKKGRELPLPPPPSPPMTFRGDFDSIRPPQAPSMPQAIPDFSSNESDFTLPDFPPALPAPAEEKEVTVFDKTLTQGAGDFSDSARKSQTDSGLKMKEETEVVRMMPHPAFIAVEDYKRIVNDTNSIRAHVMNAEGFAKKLTELKADEERALERWRSHLEDVEKKLAYVDQLIEKAEKV
ncbi:hypothetical protein J4211_03955 [Candidatus Woesearchaeota archaeon]|nr:hypothetical protein [Candidatus Woesearchaeota archaeon]